jgi:hypothetical protein
MGMVQARLPLEARRSIDLDCQRAKFALQRTEYFVRAVPFFHGGYRDSLHGLLVQDISFLQPHWFGWTGRESDTALLQGTRVFLRDF